MGGDELDGRRQVAQRQRAVQVVHRDRAREVRDGGEAARAIAVVGEMEAQRPQVTDGVARRDALDLRPAVAAAQEHDGAHRHGRAIAAPLGGEREVDAVVGVGADNSGELVVPDHDVGWYNASASPGQGENVVFWGHVLRFRQAPKIPAPFERMKEVRIGASVTVYDDQGQAHAYRVTQKVEVTPDQVAYILPQGSERVTMVSCYGDFVIIGREVVDMTRRLIVIAEPV